MITVDHFIVVFVSCLFYSCCNALCSIKVKVPESLKGKEARDYIGQHISLIHSAIASVLSIIIYIKDNGVQYEDQFEYRHVLLLGHSLGYMVYDSIYAELYGVHDLAMRFHHFCTVLGGSTLFIQDKGGSIACLCILITETSNPCMMMRHILKSQQKDHTLLFKTFELVFAGIFIFNR